MSETQPETPAVDRAVTRVMEILRAYKNESWNELILATGIGKHTMLRRRAHGGWTAAEVAVLAEHFEMPVSAFYAGPDALFQAAGGPMNPRYAGDNDGGAVNGGYADENEAVTTMVAA